MLPDDIKVSEAIWLDGCTGLKSLPAGLDVCDLFLHGCSSLSSLPRGLKVRDFLSLHDCVSLERIPDDLEVGSESVATEGLLCLSGCLRLELFYCEDPERIRGLADVTEGFSLDGWLELTSLPEGLEVRGSLGLRGCVNLGKVPKGLRVGRQSADHSLLGERRRVLRVPSSGI